ncbi:AAA domain-containing protein [Streptomyces antimycoticus]
MREVVHRSQQRLRNTRSQELLWLGDLPAAVRRPEDRPDGLLLALEHVPRAAAPVLPAALDGWVNPASCEDADGGDPDLQAEGPEPMQAREADGRGEERTVRREDCAEVLSAYTAWVGRWRRWAARERTDRPVRELYEGLYRWYQRLVRQDDQLELVLATGLLMWQDANGEVVHRHVLTHRAEITVERRTARLAVRLSPGGAVRVEDQDFLDSEDGWLPEQAAAVDETLAADAGHPLGTAALEQLVHWQERVLTRPVTFSADWQVPKRPEAQARLVQAPALVLRVRDRNALLRYYKRIGERLSADGSAPLGLAQLVVPLEQPERLAWQSTGPSVRPGGVLGADPLFPLKTNPQQRSVLARLEQDTAVVVQGPPGTGKTHTIANLVSALLAQGQRVLVTSARDQALTVLRDKLPPPVRDLCVLMLSSVRQEGSDELERTVNALIDQVAATDAEQLRSCCLSGLEDGVFAGRA